MAGIVIGTIGVIRAISYASLIFSGSLSDQISVGIGMTVLSTGVIGLIVALLSDYPGMIATPLAAPTVLLALLADTITQTLEAQQASPDVILITVLTTIALVSVITGVLFLLVGSTRQGERICVVPYPVVGGFMAGTGWLLVDGFFQITTDMSLSLQTLPVLLQTQALIRWLPGLGFALILLTISRKARHFLVIPSILSLATGFFFLMVGLSQISLHDAHSLGFFLGPFPDSSEGLWHPLSLSAMAQVEWSAIVDQAASILTVSLISLLSLILSNNAIELAVSQDISLNRQLMAIGVANIGSGLFSGMVGTQALPSTILAHDMQASRRWTGILTVIPVIAVLGFGASFLGYLPKAVLGSLILYLGLSLFIQWLVESWSKLPFESYLIILIMLITVAQFGFLKGVMIGFLMSLIHFAYSYSQRDVVKSTLNGGSTRSNAFRTAQENQFLTQYGDCIHLMELQGYIFFGTAPDLLKRVCDRALSSSILEGEKPHSELKYLVVDFKEVIGLDSSAVSVMGKISKLANQKNFKLLFTNLSDEFQALLVRGGSLDIGDACKMFPDIDRALEWAENQLLTGTDLYLFPNNPFSQDLPLPLKEMLTEEEIYQFMGFLEPLRFPAKYTIFKAAEAKAGLYFITAGQVSVLLEMEDGGTKRLQTCSQGNLLGEMRFFGKSPLSSQVITDTETELLYLSPIAFEKMKQMAPTLTHALQEYIVKVLCDSLIRREEQLRVIQ
jgi:SulP family sulfate permease